MKLQDKARVTINNCFRKVFGKWGIFSASREFVSRNLTTWGAMRRIDYPEKGGKFFLSCV